VYVGLAIDGPGILGRAGARGQARDERIEALAAEAVSRERHRIGHVTKPDGGANEQSCAFVRREPATNTCLRADAAHDVVSSPHKRAHCRAADGAGGTKNEYAPRMR
jgi:hypothetical protein